MHPGPPTRPSPAGRTLAAALLALALAVAGALVPAVAPALPLPAGLQPPVVRAADDIDITTAARYTVQPDDGRVRVVVEITAVNRKPNQLSGGGVTRYFYESVNLGVQPEARAFRATQDDTPTAVRVADREGYRLVTVRFRERLYFGETATLRLVFNLPGGAPRSASDVRVGPAFATFTAWAFGDAGTIRIAVPADFRVDIAGGDIDRAPGRAGFQVWTAAAADPLDWYALVTATNDAGLVAERLVLQDGERLVIRSWPDDPRWRSRVRALLRDGLPELAALVGLPWPVEGTLLVTEVHTPLLEGYAGFYDPATDEITISEDLDDLTIVHEASHAWFNAALFEERWITEGLADEYAARALRADDRGYPGPGEVSRSDPAAFALEHWPPPAAIRDADADARERYGYAASWTLVRRIVARVGEAGMREVLAAAATGTTAYPGEGPAEPSRQPNDWRRFLDLAEQAGDPATVNEGNRTLAELFALWVLSETQAAPLPARAEALEAYARLGGHGDAWAPPGVVRMELDRWRFPEAMQAMERSEAVLELRDEVAALAEGMDLDPDPSLETRYQDADSVAELNVLADTGAHSLDVLEAIIAADGAADAPRDWLVEWGLDGFDPDAGLAAAGAAWESGDLDTAATAAAEVTDTLAAAPEAGRSKAILAGGLALAVLVVLALAVLVVLGRRRGRGPGWPRPVTATAPEVAGPCATLPPDGLPAEPPSEPPSGDTGADRR